MTEGNWSVRLKVLASVLAFMFAALVTRLWFLQVLATEDYRARARANRVEIAPLPAPRGKILDRTGVELVTNRASTVVTIEEEVLSHARAESADRTGGRPFHHGQKHRHQIHQLGLRP